MASNYPPGVTGCEPEITGSHPTHHKRRELKGVYFSSCEEDILTVEPATESEKKWIRSLQRVLQKCPERLGLLTTGDAFIQIIDRDGAHKSDLHDGNAGRNGVVVATIKGKPLVHGVS